MTRHSQSRHRGIAVAAAFALLSLTCTPAIAADDAQPSVNAVVAWDLTAQTAIRNIARDAQLGTRGFAMVNGAVYDAVNAIAGTPYEPYLVAPHATGAESTDAAVGTAAYLVLDTVFPEERDWLRQQYDEWLAGIPDGHAKRGGIRVGGQTAAAMIAARGNDGVAGPRLWSVGDEPGQWRPTPSGFVNAGGWLGDLRPFAIPDATMFRTPGPPALTSHAYARDLNEVKRLGSATSTARTADQTEAARWWHDWRAGWGIKRDLAVTHRLSVLDTARLFALADVAGEDGAIACANDKEYWRFWRPVTAIRLADTDGNPRTTADPDWTPLLETPPLPDYPSGHTCRTGAQMAAYAYFFGRDTVSFSSFSVDTGTTRHFTRFSQAVDEVVGARIWGGIHFRTADVDGVGLGRAVNRYVVTHYFQPRHHN